MNWRSHSFFLKFIACAVGGGIAVLGFGVLFGDVFHPYAVQLRGYAIYDGIADLVLLIGKWPTGIGLVLAGIVLWIVCYRRVD